MKLKPLGLLWFVPGIPIQIIGLLCAWVWEMFNVGWSWGDVLTGRALGSPSKYDPRSVKEDSDG